MWKESVGTGATIEAPDVPRANVEGEDWRWMVAADPAFYLDESGGTGAPGESR